MGYVLRRIGYSVLVLVAVSVASFGLIELAPGEFFDELRLNPRIAPETVAGLREQYGLTAPPVTRYVRWLTAVGHGDLGFSLAYHTEVSALLWVRAQNTLLLTIPAMVVAWFLAVPLGVWCAVHRGGGADRLCAIATSALLTLPELLVAILCLVVALRTGWFPTGGMSSSLQSGDLQFAARARDVVVHAALPVCALAGGMVPVVFRHVRASMLDVLDAPPLRAARGHGIRPARLLWRYAVPMAANPLVSLAGLSVGMLLSASLLVEVVMGWPGLGPLLLDAVLARDLYVVIGASMLSTVFLVVGNLLADLTLFAVDPRIRAC